MGRRGYVAAALAVLVLLLVPVGLVPLIIARDRVPVESATSVDEAYAIDGPLTCDSQLRDVPTLPLEAEPVAMLVCADPAGSQPWTAPAEVVEGDLGRLVEVLSDLEPTPLGDYACTRQAGPAYDLLLRFSRDRFARVHGDASGCGIVTVASGDSLGAVEVLEAALALVERQRAATEPPAEVAPVDLDCNAGLETGLGPALSLTGDVADLTTLVSCWQPDADELPPLPPGTEVRPRDVRTLVADMSSRAFESKRPPPPRCPGGLDRYYYQSLVGQTRWGDLLVVYGACQQFWLPGTSRRWWIPSPTSQRILDDLRR
jgi:hypothetical protein